MITVAVDIDGVVYDIIGHIVDKFRPHLDKLRPTKWDCWPDLETDKAGFFKMYSECWEETAKNPQVGCKYTDPYADNLFTYLQRNKELRTAIITKRSKKDIGNTIEWLNHQGFHYDTFTVITDIADKTNENFDVIIEDNPKNIPLKAKMGILVTQEWNKDLGDKGPFIRVNSLQVIPDLLKTFLPFWSHQQSLQCRSC